MWVRYVVVRVILVMIIADTKFKSLTTQCVLLMQDKQLSSTMAYNLSGRL
jgi:hypothetical protein